MRTGRKSQIATIAIAVLVLGAAGDAYAYDSSHKGEIADGITIGSVEVGGLSEAGAEAKLRRMLLDPAIADMEELYDLVEVGTRSHWLTSGP